MKKLIAMALMALVGVAAFGADLEKFILRGYVNLADTADWVPVDSFMVSLTKNDTVPVPFRLLTGNEESRLNPTSEFRLMVYDGLGTYQLHIDKEGYDPLDEEFKITSVSQTVRYLHTLKLRKERSHMLQELTVKATAVKMVMDGDTIVYNADAFQLADGSMLDALIQQLPGVLLDSQGQITVNGRKVNELIVNGKDFFQGDPKIALENLPAYTVKNLKVYDRAGKDEYLTHATDRLDRDETQENLVMDVVLKKEYSVGYIANAEAGYGLNDRYMGRLFGIGFGEKWRVTAFGNFNNLSNTSEAGSDGEWRDWHGGSGVTTVKMGGLAFQYDDKKTEYSGDVQVTGEEETSLTERAYTRFFESGNIYQRSKSDILDRSVSVRTTHRFIQRWDNFFLRVNPSFSYSRSKVSNRNLSANFTEAPFETYRTEAVDSVFGPAASRSPYWRNMLYRTGTLTYSRPENLWASLMVEGRYQPRNWAGSFNTRYRGNYTSSPNEQRTVYAQAFGDAHTETGSLPTLTDRFKTTTYRNSLHNAMLQYSHKFSRMTETHATELNIDVNLTYEHVRTNDLQRLDTTSAPADYNAALAPLPSLRIPEGAMQDLLNSPHSLSVSHKFAPQAYLRFSHSPVAPGDSTMNLSYEAAIGLYPDFDWRSLDYRRPGTDPQHVEQNTADFKPHASFGLRSSNKARMWTLHLSYRMAYNYAPLTYQLRAVTSSTPNVEYRYDGSLLKREPLHSLQLYGNFYSRKHEMNGYLSANATLPHRAIGQAMTYNPQTGHTIYQPMNIDGNWDASIFGYFGGSFGRDNAFDYGASVNAGHTNSVDFITDDFLLGPQRSVVRNTRLGGELQFNYTLDQGSSLGISGGTNWSLATSPRANFKRISAFNHRFVFEANGKLPLGFELGTTLTLRMLRGYEDPTMNTTEWLWNASLQKSILKGALTFRLTAVDILGQLSQISSYVDAQGHTEVWMNSLPRYAMLTVGYRFNYNPKKK